ncbi:sensor histidine kinase [Fulvimarina endophytica]|nr:ATP-binding protein [Fulvimarina endophytica]
MTGPRSNRSGARGARLTLFQQFSIVATISFALVMITLGWWVSKRISDGILQRSAEAGALFMQSVLEPHIQSLVEGRPLSSADIAQLRAISDTHALRKHVMSIKIWEPNGRIAFSSQPDLIGQSFPTDEIQPALNGEIKGYLNQLEDDENAFERTLSVPLYEIYAPLYRSGSNEIIAVGEFYENAERLNNELLDAVRDNWLVVGSAGLALLMVLFAIVYRGSVTIERQKRDLEARHAREIGLHKTNAKLRGEMQIALQKTARIDHMLQRRLGAELHDGPAQLMAFVLLRLDDIDEAIRADRSEEHFGRETLSEVRAAVQDSLADLRAIAAGLFMPFLKEGSDITEVVRAIALAHDRRTGGTTVLSFENVEGITAPDLVQAIARIVQEAMTNAEKHAGDPSPRVVIRQIDGEIEVTIQDRGPGLENSERSDADRNGKLGLDGIRYRAGSLGGSAQFESGPGGGTLIRCRIPFPSDSA